MVFWDKLAPDRAYWHAGEQFPLEVREFNSTDYGTPVSGEAVSAGGFRIYIKSYSRWVDFSWLAIE